jgi:hypothetical protein
MKTEDKGKDKSQSDEGKAKIRSKGNKDSYKAMIKAITIKAGKIKVRGGPEYEKERAER